MHVCIPARICARDEQHRRTRRQVVDYRGEVDGRVECEAARVILAFARRGAAISSEGVA